MKRHKKRLWLSVLVGFVVLTGFGLLPTVKDDVLAQSGEDHGELTGWAWSSNIGWVSFNSKNISNQGASYKVIIDSNNYLSGYAWSSNIGWIRFDPSFTGPDNNGEGAKLQEGQLIGWARACSVFVNGCEGPLRPDSQLGGWDGWISMYNVNYDSTTGGFSGFAWGALNIGWLKFGINTKNGDSQDNCPVQEINGCCPTRQVCVDGGGGLSVGCSANPSSTYVNQNITYTANVSGGPDNVTYTYNWVSGSNPPDSNDLGNASLPNTETFTTSYPNAGTYQVKVEVYDSDGTLIGSASCNEEVGVRIIDEGEQNCQINIGNDDSYGINLHFGVNTPRYSKNGVSYYRSTTNQKVSLSGCNSENMSITTDQLPNNVSLICSPAGSQESWGVCEHLTQGDYLVGVYAGQKPSGYCYDITLKLYDNGQSTSSNVNTEVCFTGSAGN